jgi:CheY-like chemotaxis protein
MLAVTDTGTGMSPEVMRRAFEPFFTTKRKGQGTGLGLSMVYGFAKQSGGHLKIYSELGHGTTMKLYLPRTNAALASTITAVSRPDELPRGTETVLIAEDNEGLLHLASEQLSNLGYHVLQAKDGEAALAILMASDPVDLLFTDVVMTGRITGHELARKGRKHRPGLKVLVTTGYAENASKVVGGGTHFLRKPYRRRDLALKVRSILDQS